MKKRKVIGIFTFLSALPGVGVVLLFGFGGLGVDIMTFLAVAAFLCRGVCGTVGGVLLCMGKKSGYFLSSIAWGYLLIIGLFSFYQIFTGGFFTSFEFTPENHMFWKMFAKSIGKIFWGSLLSFILIKDLLHKEETINEVPTVETA
jgi:hypothetical protein